MALVSSSRPDQTSPRERRVTTIYYSAPCSKGSHRLHRELDLRHEREPTFFFLGDAAPSLLFPSRDPDRDIWLLHPIRRPGWGARRDPRPASPILTEDNDESFISPECGDVLHGPGPALDWARCLGSRGRACRQSASLWRTRGSLSTSRLGRPRRACVSAHSRSPTRWENGLKTREQLHGKPWRITTHQPLDPASSPSTKKPIATSFSMSSDEANGVPGSSIT